MTLLAPIWLVLLIPAALALGAWRPPPGPLRVLRGVTWVLLIAALCEPVVRLPGRNGVLVVVADRSESMPADGLVAQPVQIARLQSGRSPGQDLAVVAFRQTATLEMRPGEGRFGGFRGELPGGNSNLHAALERALDLIPADSRGRILVLSDGQWSGADPGEMASRAALRGVPIDYQRQSRPGATDLALLEFVGPDRVGRGEGFILTAWYQAPDAGPVHYELRRHGTPIAAGTASASRGRNRLLFRDLGQNPGVAEYVLHLTPGPTDAVLENNTARLLVQVEGPRPLLLVRPGGPSGLARSLRASGLKVTEMAPGARVLGLAELARFTAVILENVPARAVGTDSLQAIAAWVQAAGTGLMLTGGEQGYGQGGYLHSPLDPILPLSLEIRREHRKSSLAVVIALDRSGSMAAPAGQGRTKMDLANLGTVEVINLLSDLDHVGVLAVDSVAHMVLPLSPIAEARQATRKVLSIESAGGGIFVYEALRQAAAMLARAPQKNRHIILFADAADAEAPGDYVALIAACRQAGITVSVVGLGSEQDHDALLLRDLAAQGGGRVFFSAIPEELPAIFAQETVAVTGSSFSDQPAGVQFGAPWLSLGGLPVSEGPTLDGYNLCFARPEALVAAATAGPDPSPVVAFWQAGAGRVLCYTGEADGPFGRSLAAWPRAGEFFATLGRWTAGAASNLPGHLVARRRLHDGRCQVELYLDPDAAATALPELPRVHWLRGEPGREPVTTVQTLAWTAPDQLRADQVLQAGETVLPVLELPGGQRVPLPAACLPYSQEFAPVPPGRGAAALARLAAVSGGREVLELGGLWDTLPRSRHPYGLRPALFLAALVSLLLEVLQRRTGWWRRPVPRPVAPVADTSTEREPVTSVPPPLARSAVAPPAPAPPVAPPLSGPPSAPARPADGTRPDPLSEARARAQRRTQR